MWFIVTRLDDNFVFDLALDPAPLDGLCPSGDEEAIYAECFFDALNRLWNRPDQFRYVPDSPGNNPTTRIYVQERTGFIIEVKRVG